jgi:dihydrofolate reductase
MIVSLIVCMAQNRVIGRAGGMPWRMPSDLKHFRATTLGKAVVRGRKTFQSVGKPLDGRTNYVVSRQRDLAIPGVVVVSAIADALQVERSKGASDVMVIGGGEIYAAALAVADRVIATVLAVPLDGDTTFPELPVHQWRIVSRTPLVTGPKDDYAADVVVYERAH